MIFQRQLFHVIFSFLFIGFLFESLLASRVSNRYFPFITRSENLLGRERSYTHAKSFLTVTSSAFKRSRGSGGVPQLWGEYDLTDVVNGLLTMQPSIQNPIIEVTGSDDLVGKSMIFKVTEKSKSFGLLLGREESFGNSNLSVGFQVPVMYSYGMMRYGLIEEKELAKNLGVTAVSQILREHINTIRRTTHDLIGFPVNNWAVGGLGDLDMHVRWRYFLEYQYMMKSINISPQIGVLFPTGKKRDIDNPASLPFGNNGHWGIFLDLASELELKQDLKIGLLINGLFSFSKTQKSRIPVFKEPAIFSALVGRLRTNKGAIFRISPYLVLGNLTDGLSIQGRYTYTRHSGSTQRDVRINKTIPSFLTQKPSVDQTASDIATNIAEKEHLSKWRSHHISLQLVYNSKEALKNWTFTPNFYMTYDSPFGGSGISKTHQFSLGVELHF